MRHLLLLLLVFTVFSACLDDDDNITPTSVECGTPIIIADQTDIPATDFFSLANVEADGLCLTVTLGASGCSSEDWTFGLRTSGEILESSPTLSSAYMVFDDQVPGGATCLAFFTESFTIDLSPYLSQSDLPSNLTLIGPDTLRTTILIE